jgi:hypothetical protein
MWTPSVLLLVLMNWGMDGTQSHTHTHTHTLSLHFVFLLIRFLFSWVLNNQNLESEEYLEMMQHIANMGKMNDQVRGERERKRKRRRERVGEREEEREREREREVAAIGKGGGLTFLFR